ncbi:esterase/lipase family protein [Nocardioides limicola]|uniref:esterase/lipase family protein n=1 Tax=Nocardioides limicola TaxID=2803368 RepID=UPI00193B9E11|nr:lipase [Nocardioides sp. DJM-14]
MKLAVHLLCLALAATPMAAAEDGEYAPLDRPGPELSVPTADLEASLECHGDPSSGPRAVLLSPGTSVTPKENFSWNWQNVFTDEGRYWCAVWMPYNTFGDIQVAGEYHVHAIRTMYEHTGEPIAILGHSQGGMNPRWALRFWPDVRPLVSDVIGMAPSNHGTTMLMHCIEGVTTCPPAVWQQTTGSNFMEALNSLAETFAGISYTNIYTALDAVVQPTKSSGLTTGDGEISNIAVQEFCPLDPYEHLLMGTVSPAVHALVMDALLHDGPAKIDRADSSACTRLSMPGVDPTSLDSYTTPLLALPTSLSTVLPFVNAAGAPMVDAEPALRCYVHARGCATAVSTAPTSRSSASSISRSLIPDSR